MPSEDPYLGGQYGSQIVQGIQETDVKPPHIKIAAALKVRGDSAAAMVLPPYPPHLALLGLQHFAVYNMETGRMTADYNVSAYDLANTFLPGFKEATSSGGALGFMCSYSSINGVPSWCVIAVFRFAMGLHLTFQVLSFASWHAQWESVVRDGALAQ